MSLTTKLGRGLAGVLLGALSAAAQVPAGGTAVPDRPPIRAGCEPDYPPYCIVAADQQADGFSVELLRAALKAVGREVSFKTAPWSELKQDLAEGRLQALPLVGRTPEREEIYDFTFPYLTMHGAIVVRDDTADIRSAADLKGKTVAVLQGDNAEEYLRRADLGAVIVPLPSFETALRQLSEGRHDAVVIQKLLAYQLMAQAGLKNLRAVGPPLSAFVQSFCFAVRNGDSDLLAALNEGLSLVMADGTFRALYTKWFATIEAAGRSRSRLVLGGDNDYPPYEFLDGNGQPAGFNVDLTRAIARHMGLAVDLRLEPWSAMRKRLAAGEVDGVQGMFYSFERDKEFSLSAPHSVVQHAFVVREGSPEMSSLADLAGKTVVVMAGDIMEDLVLKQGLGPQVVAVTSQEEALRLVAAGKYDAALVAVVPALYWIQQHGWSNLRVSGHSVLAAEYCYAVAHGREDVLALFSEGLGALKATGEYRQIQARWLSPYEAPPLRFRELARIGLMVILPLLALLLASVLWSRSLKRQVAGRTRELTAEIAERRQAEAALLHAKEDFSKAFMSSPTAVSINTLADGRYVDVNAAWEQLSGHPRGEAVGRTTLELEIWADVHDRQALRRLLAEDGRIPSREVRFRRRSGEVITCLLSMEVISFGAETCFISTTIDITVRKGAEDALRKSEEKFSLAFMTSPYAITVTRLADGKLLEVNDAFETVSEFSRDEALANSSVGLAWWADPVERQTIVEDLRQGRSVVARECHFRKKSGAGMIGQISCGIIVLQDEPCILTSINDITARKEAETKLKAQVDELRRWHEITMGRELRVIELKREINLLLVETGRPARYASVAGGQEKAGRLHLPGAARSNPEASGER